MSLCFRRAEVKVMLGSIGLGLLLLCTSRGQDVYISTGVDGPKLPAETVETVVVELGPQGFYPAEIQRKTGGKFYLFLRVNLGKAAVQVKLDSDRGATLKQSELTTPGKRWGQLVDLPPGKYKVHAPGRVNHVLTITVP